ncbi:hypothetical protein B0H16DRAFT_1719429 [Mycena metata]|uniref:Uncharacterized protein n=1 Tax=Mycena metata TaxID=1033252 RepID=A0AAD7JEH7_9AGAR|nr:hypothetical protein B0H16DRAFT_1719429 [Mycena metata]
MSLHRRWVLIELLGSCTAVLNGQTQARGRPRFYCVLIPKLLGSRTAVLHGQRCMSATCHLSPPPPHTPMPLPPASLDEFRVAYPHACTAAGLSLSTCWGHAAPPSSTTSQSQQNRCRKKGFCRFRHVRSMLLPPGRRQGLRLAHRQGLLYSQPRRDVQLGLNVARHATVACWNVPLDLPVSRSNVVLDSRMQQAPPPPYPLDAAIAVVIGSTGSSTHAPTAHAQLLNSHPRPARVAHQRRLRQLGSGSHRKSGGLYSSASRPAGVVPACLRRGAVGLFSRSHHNAELRTCIFVVADAPNQGRRTLQVDPESPASPHAVRVRDFFGFPGSRVVATLLHRRTTDVVALHSFPHFAGAFLVRYVLRLLFCPLSKPAASAQSPHPGPHIADLAGLFFLARWTVVLTLEAPRLTQNSAPTLGPALPHLLQRIFTPRKNIYRCPSSSATTPPLASSLAPPFS